MHSSMLCLSLLEVVSTEQYAQICSLKYSLFKTLVPWQHLSIWLSISSTPPPQDLEEFGPEYVTV